MSVHASPQVTAGMSSAWSRRLSLVQDASLVCISALFFYVNLSFALTERSLGNVFFVAEQALLVGMFLTRRRSQYTSPRISDWVVATLGGWLPLVMRPHETGGGIESIGTAVQFAGLAMVILGFATLGKSFGIVAANRGLKVGGLYRIVRHPIYLAHSITLTGFVMANFWWFNAAILLLISVFQLLRIRAEERVLTETSDYAVYKERVPWRLIPGLY